MTRTSSPIDLVSSAFSNLYTAVDIFTINPDDNTDLENPIRAIRSETAGNVRVITFAGNDRIFFLPAGQLFLVGITRVLATNTTASGLTGFV